MSTNKFSLVEYYYDDVPRKYSCGYCKKKSSYKRHGMWAHHLSVEDYQNLIDRGWRRSGCYCYKPMNDETCCPMYTIRCDALNFKISKSQKKILKRMERYLQSGEKEEDDNKSNKRFCKKESNDVEFGDIPKSDLSDLAKKAQQDIIQDELMLIDSCDKRLSQSSEKPAQVSTKSGDERDVVPVESRMEETLSQSVKTSSETTMPRKKKLIRIERARNRLLAKGKTLEEIEAFYRRKKRQNMPKLIEELLPEMTSGKMQLAVNLVRVSTEEFMETLDESVELFKKYQMAVHNDKPEECDKKSFLNFLGQSPLHPWKPTPGPALGYGSFHQQYRLDGKLIAVGVIDILPYCVSSVYLFYDPEYSFLTLGTFSSLMEVRLVRELNQSAPNLKYYYMGYYIHNLQKMRYKAKMRPSNLLCPETYVWYDIEKCIPKLEKNKYSRLNEDIDAIDEDGVITPQDLRQVRVYYKGQRLYGDILDNRGLFDRENDMNEVKEYAELVGKTCAHSMRLYRVS